MAVVIAILSVHVMLKRMRSNVFAKLDIQTRVWVRLSSAQVTFESEIDFSHV